MGFRLLYNIMLILPSFIALFTSVIISSSVELFCTKVDPSLLMAIFSSLETVFILIKQTFPNGVSSKL